MSARNEAAAGEVVDLRSDTVTIPTAGMLQAMMNAQVGDDVYGEDPTANSLEARFAEMMGMEAALFVSSGTMANLVAIKTLTHPGEEVILDADSHCYHYETGGYAAIAGVGYRFAHARQGIIQPEQIPPLVRPPDMHFARTRLVVLENTHNRGGGSVYPVQTVERIGQVCREHGLQIYMDGARLFNACIAAGASPVDYARHVDAVGVCLSKGLGCPVGSMLAGTREFIAEARRLRKVLGGGMRQIGYLAAAGIYALEHNIERLAEDHQNARILADGIRQMKGLKLIYDPPQTNMVYFDVVPPHRGSELSRLLRQEGILIDAPDGTPFRAVTHLGVSRAGIERTVQALRTHFG
jgi:threonine aldolase